MTTYIEGQRNLYSYAGGEINPDRRVRDVADEISLLDPNDYALLVLLRKLRKKGSVDPKFEWFEDTFPAQTTTADGAQSSASGTVDVAAGTGPYGRAGDLWMVADTGEIIYILSVTTDAWTVIRGVGALNSMGGTAAAAIADADDLYYIGNAQKVGELARTSLTMVTETKYNYCQLFKEAFEVDNTANATKLYGGADMTYLRRKHGIVHQRDIERALWMGEKQRLDTNNGLSSKVAYVTGGVDQFITGSYSVYNASSAYTEDEFDANLRTGFRYGNKVKFMFCCPLAMSVISSWGRDKLQLVPRDTTYGINITRFISPHGELNLINNKLFGDISAGTGATGAGSVGNWATASVILDLENLKYRTLRDTKLEMGIQENDRDATEDQYLTECGLELRQPSTHMEIWGWALS